MPIYGAWPQDDGCVWLNLLKSLAANSVSWGLLPGVPFSLGELVVLCPEPRFPRLLAFFMGLLFELQLLKLIAAIARMMNNVYFFILGYN